MDNQHDKLMQFNEVWDGRRLFTACIEFMLWYELNENVQDGRGLPEVETSYWAMVDAIRSRINYFSKDESSKRSKPKRDTLDLFPFSLRETQPIRSAASTKSHCCTVPKRTSRTFSSTPI